MGLCNQQPLFKIRPDSFLKGVLSLHSHRSVYETPWVHILPNTWGHKPSGAGWQLPVPPSLSPMTDEAQDSLAL